MERTRFIKSIKSLMDDSRFDVNILWRFLVPSSNSNNGRKALLFDLKYQDEDETVEPMEFTGVYIKDKGLVMIQGCVKPDDEGLCFEIVDDKGKINIESFYIKTSKSVIDSNSRFKVFCLDLFDEPAETFWMYEKISEEFIFAIAYTCDNQALLQIDNENPDKCERLENICYEIKKVLSVGGFQKKEYGRSCLKIRNSLKKYFTVLSKLN